MTNNCKEPALANQILCLFYVTVHQEFNQFGPQRILQNKEVSGPHIVAQEKVNRPTGTQTGTHTRRRHWPVSDGQLIGHTTVIR